jgi:predicted TPR repeat methyltransferase
MDRYGKPSGDILGLKEPFFRDNEGLLRRSLEIAESYAAQPARTRCMNCAAELGRTAFRKHGVSYAVCARCTQLNGTNVDTDEFTAALYTSDGGSSYAVTYDAASEDAYRTRLASVYRPKAQFLLAALREDGADPAALRYVDLGAGSGYFVAALLEEGVADARGYDVSEAQVALARHILGDDRVVLHDADQTLRIAAATDAQVVSMIGVLEHLQEPRETLRVLRANPHVQFVYASVPAFSLSVFIELAFPDVFPRHLSGGHTHLYTDASLRWLEGDLGLERVAQWWFGTDVVDLFRSLSVTLAGDEDSAGAVELLREKLGPAIDGMQFGLDERHLASEVHVLWRVA